MFEEIKNFVNKRLYTLNRLYKDDKITYSIKVDDVDKMLSFMFLNGMLTSDEYEELYSMVSRVQTVNNLF